MKKALCVLLALIVVFTFCFISCNNSKTNADLLKEVNVVRDSHGRIIQQIFYKTTCQYIFFYRYKLSLLIK